MIENRLLHYFLAIAREQNISRAAEVLHVTPSTLSMQMMDGETVAMDWFAGCFSAFHKQHPDVALQVHSGDADSVMERLDKGLSDIGLVLGPIKQERFHYTDIHKKDIYGLLMRADDSLAKQDHISLAQMKTIPLILAEQTFSGHQELTWFGSEYDSLNVVATYNLIYNVTWLVEHGIGYALCLDRLVNTAGRELVFRPIEPEIAVELFLVTKKYQTFSPAVKAFMSTLQENMQSCHSGRSRFYGGEPDRH